MAFAIRGPTPPPLMAKFPVIFLPHFSSFAIESYIYETDFILGLSHNIKPKLSAKHVYTSSGIIPEQYHFSQLFSHAQSHLNFYIYI